MLRVLLCRHPAICGGGELCVFDKRNLFRESDRCFRRKFGRWLEYGYPADWYGPDTDLFNHLSDYPWTREELVEAGGQAANYRELLQCFFQRLLKVTGKRRWLEKTPSNVYCFDRIREIFPDAQFIHIVRDGRDCVVSYCRRGEDPFRAVSRWYYAALTGIQYRSWPNYYELKYEDLVQNPERELRRLCAFLKEEYTNVMLQPESRSEKIQGWQSDPEAAVNQRSVGQYRAELSPFAQALFQRVHVSRHGLDQLPFRGTTTGILSPIQLQQHLGYATDMLSERAELDPGLCARSWRQFKSFRWKILRRYSKWIRCPTEIR